MSAQADTIHEKIASEVYEIRRGMCWCVMCGRRRVVDGAQCLAHGWPTCCGQTMTIDSPQKRAAMKRTALAPGELVPQPDLKGTYIHDSLPFVG